MNRPVSRAVRTVRLPFDDAFARNVFPSSKISIVLWAVVASNTKPGPGILKKKWQLFDMLFIT